MPTPSLSTLPDWLGYIESLHPSEIELGLGRVKEVAARLGIGFDVPVLIVGGTNGKGSTCAMLESILRCAGFRVGLHTSPHLLRFNERARIAGDEASDADLIAQFAAVEAARGETPLTYFEFTLLGILRLFQASQLDVVILEVGLGGRLDAVNMLDADCAIVTSVDLDHMHYLGDTREAIGWEKAHIFREGRVAICSDPHPPGSLLDYAHQIGADLWLFGRDFNYKALAEPKGQQWTFEGRSDRRASLPYPALRGANQLLNACAVLAALEALKDRLPVPQSAVRQGLLEVVLPARFQILPGRPVVILDVAHNPHAAAVLAHNLDNMGFFTATHAVFGALSDKDIVGIVRPLAPHVHHWHLASLGGPRGASSQELQAALDEVYANAKTKPSIVLYESPAQAFMAAKKASVEGDRILAFGSFLTVSAVMQSLHAEA